MTAAPARPSASPQESGDLLDLADAEKAAAKALPRGIWDFVAGGAGREQTLRANRTAFDGIHLVPRVLTGVSRPRTSVALLGTPVSMPVAIAPMAYQGLVHPQGELAMAHAARSSGTLLIAGALSSYPIEEIAAVGAQTWFQVYCLRDRARTADLVVRAEAAGCGAIVLTVDVPRMGRRLRDMRNAFRLPDSVTAANLTDPAASATPSSAHQHRPGTSAVMAHTEELFETGLDWTVVDWLRERTALPLVLKGVLHPDDVTRAARAGADAVIVSNHGGRQLDGALPSVIALRHIARQDLGQCRLILDGGVREGTDILKALALGADGVLVGRPALWGLAIDGAQGAAEVLGLLRTELEQAMVLTGCGDLQDARSTTTALLDNWTFASPHRRQENA